jgi:hypothetical protein
MDRVRGLGRPTERKGAPVAKGVMIVFSNPSDPAREDEYNDWYTNTHIPELLALPGFVGARRFRVTGDGEPERYAAIYDLEADDLGDVMGVITKAVENGEIHMTDAIAMEPPAVVKLCQEL